MSKKITISKDGNTIHVFEHGSCQHSTRQLQINEMINTGQNLNKYIRTNRIPILALLSKAKA